MDAERGSQPDRPDGRRHPAVARGHRERPRPTDSRGPSGSASGRTSSTRRVSSSCAARRACRRRRGGRRRCPPGRDILSRCVSCASGGRRGSDTSSIRDLGPDGRAARRDAPRPPAGSQPAERASRRRRPDRPCRRDRRPRAAPRGRPRADRPLRARRPPDVFGDALRELDESRRPPAASTTSSTACPTSSGPSRGGRTCSNRCSCSTSPPTTRRPAPIQSARRPRAGRRAPGPTPP